MKVKGPYTIYPNDTLVVMLDNPNPISVTFQGCSIHTMTLGSAVEDVSYWWFKNTSCNTMIDYYVIYDE